MKATVSWVEDVCFDAESETGHTVRMDGPADSGGQNRGPRPMELLLMGMGGCASYDVVTILKKGRQNIAGCVAELEAQRADAVPAVFTKIKMTFVVTGTDLKEPMVQRAVALSAEKYCSASIMMEKAGCVVEHAYRIIDAG